VWLLAWYVLIGLCEALLSLWSRLVRRQRQQPQPIERD
jgi:hypothetical protein